MKMKPRVCRDAIINLENFRNQMIPRRSNSWDGKIMFFGMLQDVLKINTFNKCKLNISLKDIKLLGKLLE